MRPVENALAIIGAFCVAGALLPWSLRLVCAAAAGAIVVFLAWLRWKAHAVRTQKLRTSDVYAQVNRIRAERKARFKSRR